MLYKGWVITSYFTSFIPYFIFHCTSAMCMLGKHVYSGNIKSVELTYMSWAMSLLQDQLRLIESMTHYHSFTAKIIFFLTENSIITTTKYWKMTTIDKDISKCIVNFQQILKYKINIRITRNNNSHLYFFLCEILIKTIQIL